MKRFLLVVFLSALFFATSIPKTVVASVSCPSSEMLCTNIDYGGGCAPPCIKAVTSQGGPGGRSGASGASCQCQIPATQQAGPGEQCQGDETNNNCSAKAPYCWSSPGQHPICRTNTHSEAIQQNQTGGSGPIPEPGRIACPAGKEDLNFNSLRPYQASPCGDSVKALFCSNDLNFIEDFQVAGEGDCKKRHAEGTFLCNPNHEVPSHNLLVDLADAMFPIEGNTELVQNNQNPTDQIDDSTKMNEYVSWYLNGVNNRAEYGSDKNTSNEAVNYSGPIQKLMPQAILEAQRISVIKSISGNVAQDAEDETSAPPAQPANHNQIVVCYDIKLGNLPVWLTNFLRIETLGLGKAYPKDCYKGDGSAAEKSYKKLGDWNETAFDIFYAEIESFVKTYHLYPPGLLSEIIASAKLDHWAKKTPPLPWSDKDGKPFKTSDDYQKAYNEWRGQLCAYVPMPIIGKKLFCIGIPGVTNNEFADLFPYVPLAQTVDKKGVEYVKTVEPHPADPTEISDWTYNAAGVLNAPLYFAHTQETKDLSEFLNKSYTPKNVANVPEPKSTESNQCSSVNVRSNPGDNLFPNLLHGIVVPGVSYTITQAECTETAIPCSDDNSRTCYALSCPAEVIITIGTGTKTPFANELFSSTVADSGSTFRRIYPKVESGAPVSCIADIPTVTNVTYEGTDPFGSLKVKNIPSDGGATPDSPQLTFPHIGSIYEYFLNGIQQALRPQGFGNGTPISGKYCTPTTPTDCSAANVPDSAVPSKYLGVFKSSFIDMANRDTLDCPGPQYNLATQCYNYVVSTSQKAGVNPAFTLAIWLNETGASNYCHSGPTAQDMGINLPSLYQNLPGQLDVFLKMANTKLCQGVSGFPEPMAGWLSRFQSSSGVCNAADTVAMDYYEMIRDGTWKDVSGCPKNGKFGITWPTDMSCP